MDVEFRRQARRLQDAVCGYEGSGVSPAMLGKVPRRRPRLPSKAEGIVSGYGLPR